MTVSSTNSRDLATGNGTVGPFSFTFTLQQATDMNVYVSGSVISAGLYTITPNGGSYPCVGGSISWNLLANAPATGVPLVFASAVPNTQTLSLPIETDFPEKSLENALDRNTLQIQQLRLLSDLSLHFAVTENVSALLSGQQALYLPRMNAANNALEFVSAAQIANEVTAGNGNVVGPASSTDGRPVLFDGTTGKITKQLSYSLPASAGSDGQTLQFSSGNLISVTPGSPLLKSASITATINQLPTTGAIPLGTYLHFGDWTSTGNVTMVSGTRVYMFGNFLLQAGHTLTLISGKNGGAGSTDTNFALLQPNGGYGFAPGRNPQYAQGEIGGAGGGFGGAGGNGGSDTAGEFSYGGIAYTIYDAFISSSGSGGGSYTTVGGVGGTAGAVVYLDITGNVTLNETVTGVGGNGGDGVGAGFGSGGGGGAGGGWVVRNSGNYTQAGGKAVVLTGGNGGSGSSASYGKGAAGGGGVYDVWCGGTYTAGGGATVTAGSAGATGSATTAPTAAGNGTSANVSGKAPISFI